MKNLIKQTAMLLIIWAGLSACLPEFDAEVSELDTAITWEDKEQDFNKLNSFYLYDTVVHINKDSADNNKNRQFDEQIIELVRSNLKQLGWNEIMDPETQHADVSIHLSVLNVDITYYYYYWTDYWYWYPWYWWDPGWNYPVYPVYPPGYMPVYSYSVGTLKIDMMNMNNLEVNPLIHPPVGKVPVVWTGTTVGILAGSSQYISDRLNRQVNQVFKQSYYLSKN